MECPICGATVEMMNAPECDVCGRAVCEACITTRDDGAHVCKDCG